MIRIDKDYAALGVAFIAVLLTVWEGYEFRHHNRTAVMPSLSVYSERNFSGENAFIELGIKSVGLGPAKVTSFDVYFNNKKERVFQANGFTTYFEQTMNALQHTGLDTASLLTMDGSIKKGDLVPTGSSVNLFTVRYNEPKSGQEFRKVTAILDEKLDVFVCYCSVYEDHCQLAHIGKNDKLAPKQCG